MTEILLLEYEFDTVDGLFRPVRAFACEVDAKRWVTRHPKWSKVPRSQLRFKAVPFGGE